MTAYLLQTVFLFLMKAIGQVCSPVLEFTGPVNLKTKKHTDGKYNKMHLTIFVVANQQFFIRRAYIRFCSKIVENVFSFFITTILRFLII